MNFDSLIVAEEKQKVWTYFKGSSDFLVR